MIESGIDIDKLNCIDLVANIVMTDYAFILNIINIILSFNINQYME